MSEPTSDAKRLLDELDGLDDAAVRARIEQSPDPAGLLREMLHGLERQKVGDPGAVDRGASRIADLAPHVAPPPQAQEIARWAKLIRAPALTYTNRFEEALHLLNEASRGASDEVVSEAMLRTVQPLARLGRLDDASHNAHAAAQGFEALGRRLQAAKARVNAGVIERMRGRPDAALAAFDQARQAFAEDRPTLAQIESNRAVALLELARFDESESAFNAALVAFREAGLGRAVAIVEGNLADLDARRGRVAQALHRFERARQLFENEDAPGDGARVLAEAAEIAAGAGQTAEATRMLDQAIPRLIAAGLRAELARARLARANICAADGDPDRALTLAQEARDSFEALANSRMVAACDIQLAEAHAARGEDHEARRAFDRAIAGSAGRVLDEAQAVASALAHAAQTPDHARIASLTARLDPDALDHPILRARACLALGLAARSRGDSTESVRRLRDAIALVHAAQSALQADRFRVAFMRGHAHLLERFIEIMLDQDSAEGDWARLVFEATELARSRALLASLVAGSESPGATDDVAWRRLREELSGLYSLVERGGHPPPGVRARINEVREELYEVERRALAAALPAADSTHAPPRPEEIAHTIAQSGADVVAYYTVADELFACVVAVEGVRLHRRIASLDAVERVLSRFRFEMDRAALDAVARPDALDRSVARCDRMLEQLGTMLCACWVGNTRERVTIVPYGALHAAPWAALAPAGEPLANHHVVTVCPSASSLAQLRRQPTTGSSWALIGVADDRAPRIREEVAALRPLFPDERRLLDTKATVDAVRQVAADASLLHLATHGDFDPSHPLEARLKLGDRWTTASELFALHLPGTVIVLTGCETGASEVNPGEEAVGLARALLAAGASMLVTSQWPLHDAASLRFAEELYRHVRPGLTGSALRRQIATAANQAMRAVREQFPHPVYWAPFVCVGDGA